ncbi:hypothetical protein CAEBREN_03491 [Caenorhabditis brenneri]|uniref:Uncharacterized protein n=1 Tax=Caenorhabditis brenneri TaxID=135651 RepID=G0PAZ6_CAEBE|nr:hypothetical protein CAEBREN_03491 [Caenorhabditis brenneri]
MIIGKYFGHIRSRGCRAQVHLLKLAILLIAYFCFGMLYSPLWLHYFALTTGSLVFIFPFGLGCGFLMNKFANLLDRLGDACKTKVLMVLMNFFNFTIGIPLLVLFSTGSIDIEEALFVMFIFILVTSIISLSLARNISNCHIRYNPLITIFAIYIQFVMIAFSYNAKMNLYGGWFLPLQQNVEHTIVATLYIIIFHWSLEDLIAICIGELYMGDRDRDRAPVMIRHTYFAISVLCLLAVFINIRIARQFRFIRLDCENKWKEITIIIETHIILFLLGACIMEFWFPEHINVVLLHLMFLIGFTPYSTDFYMASVSGSSTTYEALEDIELGVVEMGSANEESHGNPSEGDDNWI